MIAVRINIIRRAGMTHAPRFDRDGSGFFDSIYLLDGCDGLKGCSLWRINGLYSLLEFDTMEIVK
jgi:hypothetical protein